MIDPNEQEEQEIERDESGAVRLPPIEEEFVEPGDEGKPIPDSAPVVEKPRFPFPEPKPYLGRTPDPVDPTQQPAEKPKAKTGRPRKDKDTPKGPTEEELTRSQLYDIASALNKRTDLSEDAKIKLLMDSTKLLRHTRMIDLALTAKEQTALRSLEWLAEREGGKAAPRKEVDPDDEVDGVLLDI